MPTYSDTMRLFYIAIAILALLVLALITFSVHLLKSKKNAMIDDKKEQAFLDNDTLRLVREEQKGKAQSKDNSNHT